jgi:NAD(P)-dependent dehydrogenase (short-subunit alcohol dehydrogenase family)
VKTERETRRVEEGQYPASDSRIVSRFYGLMERFLTVEQAVMLAYLRSRANGGIDLPSRPRRSVESALAALDRVGVPPSTLREPQVVEPAVRPVPVLEPAPKDAVPAGHETASSVEPLARYVLEPSAEPLPADREALAPAGLVMITDDRTGRAARLADRLRATGRPIVLLAPHPVERPGPTTYAVDFASPESIDRVVREVRAAHGPVAALVHALPLAGGDTAGTELDGWRRHLTLEARSLFLLLKGIRADLEEAARRGGAAVVAATALGGDFGVVAERSVLQAPAHGGIAGLIKTLALELPGVRCKVVDLDPTEDPEKCASCLEQELFSAGACEVAYRRELRTVLRAVRTPLGETEQLEITPDWVWLVTGGARGITAEICREIAARYRPTLVILGRTPLPEAPESTDTAGIDDQHALKARVIASMRGSGRPFSPADVERTVQRLLNDREIRDTLATLAGLGARVHYYAADARDDQRLGSVIGEIYARFGRLDAVVHGAGIIEDKLLRDKTVESFDRVLGTKVESAFGLVRHLRPDTLRALVFFTSVAGRFGNRGQSDYAVANEALNKLATVLDRRWAARVVAMSWGPWDRRGMVSAEIKQGFQERGVQLISAPQGRVSFDAELRSGCKGDAEIILGDGPWGREPEGAAAQPLPLVCTGAFTTTASGVQLVRALDPSRDRFLAEHFVDGRPVLPAAFAAELMAEVAQAGWPEYRVVAVRDLRVLKGVVLDEAPLEIRVTAQAPVHAPADERGLEIAATLGPAADAKAVRYRAVVQLAWQAPSDETGARVTLKGGAGAVSAREAYDRVLFHGPCLQAIRSIEQLGDDGIAAAVTFGSLPSALTGVQRPAWVMDPVALDTAAQLVLVWSRLQDDMTPLPSGFHEFVLFGPVSEATGCAVAIRRAPGGHVLECDAEFLAADGRRLGVLTGLEMVRSRALNRVGGTARAAESPADTAGETGAIAPVVG